MIGRCCFLLFSLFKYLSLVCLFLSWKLISKSFDQRRCCLLRQRLSPNQYFWTTHFREKKFLIVVESSFTPEVENTTQKNNWRRRKEGERDVWLVPIPYSGALMIFLPIRYFVIGSYICNNYIYIYLSEYYKNKNKGKKEGTCSFFHSLFCSFSLDSCLSALEERQDDIIF